MKLKKLILTLISFTVIALFTLAGCSPIKIPSGKYYAEGNSESYIEVFNDRTMLFVNIDFSEFENDEGIKNTVGEISVEEIFDGKPQEYSELFYDNEMNFYYCYVTVIDGIAFFIEWSDNSSSIVFYGITYKL